MYWTGVTFSIGSQPMQVRSAIMIRLYPMFPSCHRMPRRKRGGLNRSPEQASNRGRRTSQTSRENRVGSAVTASQSGPTTAQTKPHAQRTAGRHHKTDARMPRIFILAPGSRPHPGPFRLPCTSRPDRSAGDLVHAVTLNRRGAGREFTDWRAQFSSLLMVSLRVVLTSENTYAPVSC
jgi:hypothetical protein